MIVGKNVAPIKTFQSIHQLVGIFAVIKNYVNAKWPKNRGFFVANTA
jgi:hypothetical protein